MATSTLSSTPATNNPLHKITPSFEKMDSPEFFKMEDFDNDSTRDMDVTSTSQSNATPPPVIVQSKPAKKRKSWGQQLPEPKTTLPPRKRAKTDDEKEQRRIERIKRNRAAAHNSRERKRQEAEVLAVENAQLRTKLDAFEKHFGPLPSHIVLPEVTLSTDDADTPAPSLIESHGSIATVTSPASPPDLYDATTNTSIKQEPHDSPLMPDTYPSFDLDGKHHLNAFPTLALPDETQHSAEMLCDLPCPSRSNTRVARPNSFLPSPTTTAFLTILTTLNFTFLTTYQTLLMAMWTPSPSRRAPRTSSSAARAWTSPSTTSSRPTGSRTPLRTRSPLPSSATALAQRNAATAVSTGSDESAAGVRRPLVGEGSELRTRSGAGASGRGAAVAARGDGQDVMRAFDGRAEKGGVGRDGSLDS